jgi:hypothetical protein
MWITLYEKEKLKVFLFDLSCVWKYKKITELYQLKNDGKVNLL